MMDSIANMQTPTPSSMQSARVTPRPLGLKQPAQRILAPAPDEHAAPAAPDLISPEASFDGSGQPSKQFSTASVGQEQEARMDQPTPYMSVEQDKDGAWMMTPAPDMYSATSAFQTQASPGSIVSRRLTLTPMSRALTSSLEWVNGGTQLAPHLQPAPADHSSAGIASSSMHGRGQQHKQQPAGAGLVSSRQQQASGSRTPASSGLRVLSDSTNQKHPEGSRDRNAAAGDLKQQAQQQRQMASRFGIEHSPGGSVASSSVPVIASNRLHLQPTGTAVNRYTVGAEELTPQSHKPPANQHHISRKGQVALPVAEEPTPASTRAAPARSWGDLLASPASVAGTPASVLPTAAVAKQAGPQILIQGLDHTRAESEHESQSASLDWGVKVPDVSATVTGHDNSRHGQQSGLHVSDGDGHEGLDADQAVADDVHSRPGHGANDNEHPDTVLQGSPEPGIAAGRNAVGIQSQDVQPQQRRRASSGVYPAAAGAATSNGSAAPRGNLRPLTPSFASKFFDSDSDSSSSAEEDDEADSSLQAPANKAGVIGHAAVSMVREEVHDGFAFRPPSSPGAAGYMHESDSSASSPRLNTAPDAPAVVTATAQPSAATVSQQEGSEPYTHVSVPAAAIPLHQSGDALMPYSHQAVVPGLQQQVVGSPLSPVRSDSPTGEDPAAGRKTTAALSKAVTRVSQLSRDKQGLESLTSELQVRLIAAEEEQECQAQQLLLAEQHQALLARQLEAAEAEKSRLQRQTTQLAAALVAAQAAAAAAQNQATTLTHSQQRLQEVQAQQADEKDALKLQVLALQQQLDASADTLAASQGVVLELQTALQRTQEAAMDAEQRCEVLQQELGAAKARAEAADAASSKLQGQLSAAQQQLEQLKQVQAATQAVDQQQQAGNRQQVEALQAALLKSEQRVTELSSVEEQLAKVTQELAEVSGFAEQWHDELMDSREGRSADQRVHKEQLARVEEECGRLGLMVSELQGQVTQAVRERDEACQQLGAVQHEVQQLKQAVDEQQQEAAETLHQMSEQQLQVQQELMQLKADAQLQLEQLREAERQLREEYAQQLEQLNHAEHQLRREAQQVQDLQAELAAARSIGTAACQEVSSLSSQLARQQAHLQQKDCELQALQDLCEQLQQQASAQQQNYPYEGGYSGKHTSVIGNISASGVIAQSHVRPSEAAAGAHLTEEDQQQLDMVTSRVSDKHLHAGATQLIELRFALCQLQQLAQQLTEQLNCSEAGSSTASLATATKTAGGVGRRASTSSWAGDGHSKEAAWVVHVLSELHACCLNSTTLLQACTQCIKDGPQMLQQQGIRDGIMPSRSIENPLYQAVMLASTPSTPQPAMNSDGGHAAAALGQQKQAAVVSGESHAMSDGTAADASLQELRLRCIEYSEQVSVLESNLAAALTDVAAGREQTRALEALLAEHQQQEQQLQYQLQSLQQVQDQRQGQLAELEAVFKEAHGVALGAKAAADSAQQAMLVEHAARQEAEDQLQEVEQQLHDALQELQRKAPQVADASTQAEQVAVREAVPEQQQQQQGLQQSAVVMQLQHQLMALRAETEAVVGQYERACEQITRLRDERAQLKTITDKLQVELAAASASSQQQTEQLQSELGQQQQAHESLTAQLQQAEEEIMQLQHAQQQLTGQLQQAEEQITQLQKAQQQLTGQLQSSEQEVVQLQAALAEQQDKAEQHMPSTGHEAQAELSDALEHLQGQYKVVTDQLAATQQLLRDTTAAYSQQLDILLLGAAEQGAAEQLGQEHVVQALRLQLDQYQHLLLAAHEQLQELQHQQPGSAIKGSPPNSMPLVTAQFADSLGLQQQMQQMRTQLAAAQQRVDDKQGKLTAARLDIQQLQALLDEQQSELQEKEKELLHQQQLAEQLQAAADEGSVNVQAASAAAVQELRELKGELAAAHTALAEMQGQLQQSEGEVVQLQQELTAAQDAAAQAVRDAQADRAQLEASLHQMQSALQQEQGAVAELRQQLQQKVANEEQLRQQLQQLKEQLAQAAVTAEQHVLEHGQVLQQLAAAKEQVTELGSAVDQLQVKLQQTQAEQAADQAAHKEQLSKADEERHRLVRQLWELQDLATPAQLSEVTEQLHLSQQQVADLEAAAAQAQASFQQQLRQMKEQYAQHEQKRVRGFKRLLAEECTKFDRAAKEREQQAAAVLHETKKQVTSLTRKCEEYQAQLQEEDMQQQQQQHTLNQLADAQQQCAHYEEQVSTLAQQLSETNSECNRYELQLRTMQVALSTSQQVCVARETKLLETQAEQQQLTQECKHARAQLHQAVAAAADLQLKLQAAQHQLQQQAVIAAHEHSTEVQQLTGAMQAANDNSTQLQQQVTELTDALEAAESQNSSLNSQLASLQAHMAHSGIRASEDVAVAMAAQEARARSVAAGLEAKLVEATAAQKPLLCQIERLQGQLVNQAREHDAVVAELQHQNKATQKQLDVSQQSLAAAQRQLLAAQQQGEVLQQQLETARQQLDSEAAHAATLHESLQAALDALQHAEQEAKAQQEAAAVQLADLQAQLSQLSDKDRMARMVQEHSAQQLAGAEERVQAAEQHVAELQQQLRDAQQHSEVQQQQQQLQSIETSSSVLHPHIEGLPEWQQLQQLQANRQQEKTGVQQEVAGLQQLACSDPAAAAATVLRWAVDHMQHLQQQNHRMAKVLRRISREGNVLQQLETVRQENQALCCKYTAAQLAAQQLQRAMRRLSAENDSLTELVKQLPATSVPLLLTHESSRHTV